MTPGRRAQRGFTMVGVVVAIAIIVILLAAVGPTVATIIGILAAIAVPALRDSPKRAREATLRADLFTFRSVIDQYKGDKGMYPVDLAVLIKDGYMRKLPLDPMTKASDWVVTMEEEPSEPDDPNAEPPVPGIIDVHSNSKEKALDGTLYSEW